MKKLILLFMGYVIGCLIIGNAFAHGEPYHHHNDTSGNSTNSTASVNGKEVLRATGVVTNVKVGNCDCGDATSCIMVRVSGSDSWFQVTRLHNLNDPEGYAFLQLLTYSKMMNIPVDLYDHGNDNKNFDEVYLWNSATVR